MAFGVTLPDNIGQGAPAPAGGDSAPSPGSGPTDVAPEGASPAGTSSKAPGTEATKSDPLDLDKLDRFRFSGREWKRDEFRSALMRQEDYSRKTQELAETRRFADNFAHDLKTVMGNPARFEEFKRIYPKEFVQIAEGVLKNARGGHGPNAQPTEPTSEPNPEIQALKDEFQQLKQEREAQAVEQIQGWLDHQFGILSKKYPNADPEVVNARAEVAARQGVKITAEALDKLFKDHHGQVKARLDKAASETIKKQISVGKEGKDIGAGGGVPTGAPKSPKTFKEAQAMMIEDLKAGRSRF